MRFFCISYMILLPVISTTLFQVVHAAPISDKIEVELRDMKWGTALYNRAIRWIHAQFSVAGDEPSVRVVGGVFSERFVAHESRGHGDSAPILRSTGLTCLNTRKDYEHCGPKDS